MSRVFFFFSFAFRGNLDRSIVGELQTSTSRESKESRLSRREGGEVKGAVKLSELHSAIRNSAIIDAN